jgi:hypothetical protein
MTVLQGFHSNVQNQGSAKIDDVSQLAEKIAKGLAQVSLDSPQEILNQGFSEVFEPTQEIQTAQQVQLIIITKAQLKDLSDDRSDDLKDVMYTSLDKNDEFGYRLEKMQAAADKFITNDEYAALEQFETTNLQILVQKLEANIIAEEVNIPEFEQHLAENPNSLPQDQEADLKSIQVRTEKLADTKALLAFVAAKYPTQLTANRLEQPKYTLIDLSLSELIIERDAKLKRAVVPSNSAWTAETRQQNLEQVLTDPKYAEIQPSEILQGRGYANATVLTVIQANTEQLEHNRRGNLEKIDRKNIKLAEAQQLEALGEIEDPNRQDNIEDLRREVDKLTKFDEYHHQQLTILSQLQVYIQHRELKSAAF